MLLFGTRIPLSALFGATVMVLFILLAIFGPWITPYAPDATVGKTWTGPSTEFWLGTDNIGRDILSRIIAGAQTTIGIALVTTVLSFTLGVSAGIFASVGGPVLDNLLSRVVDMFLSVPVLIMALIVLTALGSSIPTLILTIALLDSTRVFLVARAVAVDIAARDFIDVARLRGEKMPWIMFHEILPNAMPPLISEFGLRFCFNFLYVASLSFLGLGVQPPQADWGGMVRENGQAIAFGILAPIWPALAIALVTVAVNLVVDWLLSRNVKPSGASAEL
ncbi:ABC transporter permease [Pseudogemmobacter humi]|uniref:Glutathione transport system permease protein GsiD n=1 Tax=Pseudogemmobacter humi TaxID=2483812 RepID=A0A3P5XIQ8_9RHOB|nr:ABC transporter permease [Pseudogemmobacter humi]VDC27543.1 Glutathione transport system permease protein GsiD [Pseudogemmobacter humi]